MINLKIPLITTAVTGTIGGIIGVTYWKSQSSNLRSDLLSKGKQLLDFDGDTDNTTWTKLATKHKEQTTTTPAIEKITGLDLGSGDCIAEFKTKCKEIVGKSLTDKDIDTHRKNAENWCIKSPKALGNG
ncbi:hypothetical protein A6V39_00080 [Candidatus Mycoplasma haematobovis]|uniref:Uncharacterized protein n=1 Tax=Candidatus Mycoplasma haematobovis TaxID=432608 RepID=A0A1A9QER4_9MOLU|nr:hypothetical protein [Candidatus Mycoplasma haematobovis]OAL10446.1 hypothetical protein A6V39_00080 [Candidatus Mycoplasma haematobovis]